MIKYNGKMWEGAVFDLDGTILDSMWIWESVDGRFLENHDLPVEESYLKALTSMNFPQAAAYTKKRYAMAESEAAIMEEWYTLARGMYEKEIGLKPHAAEYPEYLHRAGVKIAAATSSEPVLFEAALKNNGVYDYFHAFALSSETPHGKDTPEVYCLAARRLGTVPQKSIVFEDILKGICNARRAGFYTVAVEDKSAAEELEQIRAEADVYITDYRQMKEIEE